MLFNYEKSKAPAEKLAKELGQENCVAVACNLSGTETAHELVTAAVKRFGRLDILVANHGIWPPQDAPIEKMTDAQWRSTMAINSAETWYSGQAPDVAAEIGRASCSERVYGPV